MDSVQTLLYLLCLIFTSQGIGQQIVHITLDHDENFAVQGNPDADHDIMKRSTWTAGLEDPNQNWDVNYNTKGKAVPQEAPQAKMSEDYEVVPLNATEPTYLDRIKYYGIIPACVLGGLLLTFIFYQLIFRRRLICCSCKSMGRKAADKYVPGMVIDEEGQVDYYLISEKEREGLEDVIGTTFG